MSEPLFDRRALFFGPISRPRLQRVSSPARTKQRTIVETEVPSARAVGRQVTLASTNWRFSELSEWKATATIATQKCSVKESPCLGVIQLYFDLQRTSASAC